MSVQRANACDLVSNYTLSYWDSRCGLRLVYIVDDNALPNKYLRLDSYQTYYKQCFSIFCDDM
jgi:hypothetical protein